MEEKSKTSTEIATTTQDQQKGIVSHQESFSEESSQSESNRKVGNTKISEKSASVQSEAKAHTVQKTGTGTTLSTVVQSSFTSSKDNTQHVVGGDERLNDAKPEADSANVNELIKSFEDNQSGAAVTSLKSEIEVPVREIKHSSSSKALELINKFIDVPEPKKTSDPEAENKENVAPVLEPLPQETRRTHLIDVELRELSKELEDLKKEEERCEKTYVTRETSTSSLEEAFVKRLQERQFKNFEDMISESLANKEKRPESLPPGNLVHLLQSVQIAQELNRIIKKSNDGSEEPKMLNETIKDDDGKVGKPIDLEKLFTPATDSEEVTPSKNRKMYASSSFYSPFHPTVQDQVELARRISSSLCDISNKQSKGQSMYVNRMKRSVKWVHGGQEQSETQESTFSSDDTGFKSSEVITRNPPKNNLKLVMNPLGKVQDMVSLAKQGVIVQPPLSPEVCFELVKDLNTTKGKGAELFAKRRKKSEKWIVDENTVKQSNPGYAVPRQPPQYNVDKMIHQRESQMQKLNEVKERFNQPKLKLVKSPWEAALETGSVDTAFLKSSYEPPPPMPWTTKINESSLKLSGNKNQFREYNNELCMPNIPKGWTPSVHGDSQRGPPVSLPPVSAAPQPQPPKDSYSNYDYSGQYQPKTWDFNSFNNYNTAPRGWQHNLEYYRPVTFSTPHKSPGNAFYTDF